MTLKVSTLVLLGIVSTTGIACSDQQKPVPSGPCIGELCLGQEGKSNLTNCSGNISPTSNVTLEDCYVKNQISVVGIKSTSGVVTLVNNRSAGAMIYFNNHDCQAIKSVLEGKFGKVEQTYSLPSNVDPKKANLGHLVPIHEWTTENGRFALGGMGDTKTSDTKCRLQIDSNWALGEFDRSIKADESIKG